MADYSLSNKMIQACVVSINSSLLLGLPGLEILRQWTTGPQALRIWWSSLKSGGPENYAVIISYIFTWNSLQNTYSEAQLIITDSFGTDRSQSEHWITADDSVGCWSGFWLRMALAGTMTFIAGTTCPHRITVRYRQMHFLMVFVSLHNYIMIGLHNHGFDGD